MVISSHNFVIRLKSFVTITKDFVFQFHQFVKGDTTSVSIAPKVQSSTASPVEPNKPTVQKQVADKKPVAVVKTPKKELNGKKWVIEYQKGSLVTVDGTAEQRVYVFDCEGQVLSIASISFRNHMVNTQKIIQSRYREKSTR